MDSDSVRVAWCIPVLSRKDDLVTGVTPGCAMMLITLRVNFVVICSYLALCIVNRSIPLPPTCRLEIRDIKLKEIDTGFLRQTKSVDLHLLEVLLHLLLWLLSFSYPCGQPTLAHL